MIYAHRNGVYRDFGDIQWTYLPKNPDGTRDGWTEVTKEQYDMANDPAKKNFIPPEVKSVTVETPVAQPAVASDFGDVNATGSAPSVTDSPLPPAITAKSIVEGYVEQDKGWGEIYKAVKGMPLFKSYKSWQALKSAWSNNTL